MSNLSQEDIAEFYRILGRPVLPELYTPEIATLMLNLARRDARIAQEYAETVWSKVDLQAYLIGQSKACAEFAVALLTTPSAGDRTFHLNTATGTHAENMGQISFGRAIPIFEQFAPWLKAETTVYIRSIELHPSVRKKGFLSNFSHELGQRGMTALVLEAVQNPSFAYSLHQRSMASNEVVLLGHPSLVDFERMLSPAPTYAFQLGCL